MKQTIRTQGGLKKKKNKSYLYLQSKEGENGHCSVRQEMCRLLVDAKMCTSHSELLAQNCSSTELL